MNNSETFDVLAIAPHPDDIELCIGGTISLLTDKGYRVAVCDLTGGEMGTKGSKAQRLKESQQAAEVLGVSERINADLGDCMVADTYENRLKVADIIRRFKPTLVLCPHWEDRHPDHAATGLLTKNAVFFARLRNLPLERDIHSVSGVFHYPMHEWMQCNLIVDVSDCWSHKIDAIRCYGSQFEGADVPNGYRYIGCSDYIQAVEARGRYYGEQICRRYGEGFLFAEPISIADPVEFIKSQGRK